MYGMQLNNMQGNVDNPLCNTKTFPSLHSIAARTLESLLMIDTSGFYQETDKNPHT